jgi:hypothetical protein
MVGFIGAAWWGVGMVADLVLCRWLSIAFVLTIYGVEFGC